METDVLSHDLAPAHAALGREAATQARKAGRLHSLESAVELALAVS